MNDATADAIDRLQSIAAWLKEDPDNILFLDPDHVRILRDFLNGKYPKRLSGRVTVKALKWEFANADSSQEKATTDLAHYVVWEIGGRGYLQTQPLRGGQAQDGGIEAAKAAAQADFEARILAVIDTASALSPDQIRREALRDAKAAVLSAGYYCVPDFDQGLALDQQIDYCADAIEALFTGGDDD